MLSLAKSLLIAILVIGSLPLSAQNWEKSFAKLDAYYAYGDYAKARKGIDKIEKKVRKKLGENSPILASTLLRKAQYNLGLGLLVEVESGVEEAITLSEQVNTNNPAERAYLLKEAAKILVVYGNFRKADDYIRDSRSTVAETGDVPESFLAELDVLRAQVLTGRGYYREAINVVDSLTDFFSDRVLRAGKKDEEPRAAYAGILIAKANALRKMGDYLRSDSAFVYNEQWIERELGKTHILYAENQYLNTQLLEENGLSVEAQAKRFEDIYLKAGRKYANSHQLLMAIRESLMKAYYENGNGSKLKVVSAEFKKTISKDYPRASVYRLADDLIRLNYSLINEDVEFLVEILNELLEESSIPQNHSYRIQLLELTNQVALLQGSVKNTETYLNEVLQIKWYLYGAESPEYHLTKIDIANFWIDYSDKFDEAKAAYEESFEQIVQPEIMAGHVAYLDILNHLATYYQETDDYRKASEVLDEALLTARKKYDNKDIAYGNELKQIAGLQIKIGAYEKAEENINGALAIFDELKTREAKTAESLALITQAKLFAIKGLYDEAEDNLDKSYKLQEDGALTVETAVTSYVDLAGLYIKLGRLVEADEILEYTLEEKESQFGADSRQLNEPLVLRSELLLKQGDYTEAENLGRRANGLSRAIFGDESTKVVLSMIRLAEVYSTIGDYDKAEALLVNAIAIQKKQFGAEHVDVAKSISDLALVKYYQGASLEQVQDLFTQAETIIGAKLGASNPTYAEILKNLAIVNIAAEQYNIAFSFLDDAGRIWSAKIGRRNNINAATINMLKGDIYYRQKRYNRAERFYEDAKKQFEKFFSDSHPEFVKVQSKLSKTYFMQGDWRKSQQQMESVLSNYQDFIANYFPALSEREKTKFWNTIKSDYEFYNTLVVSKNRNSKYLGELFNNALLTKALLLNSSIKIRQRINNSDDEELKQAYANWVSKKEMLTAALSMGPQQLAENGINQSALTNEVELLEKELSLKSEIFGQGLENKAITWKNVRSSLKEQEVAMEMVRFRVFDHTFTDSVMYAMLYVTGEKRSTPQVILLPNGAELEKKYLKYYRNSIKFKLKDKFSYDQFWAPIQSELGTVSRLYLSPDGVYNQINVEALPTPDGRYVLDNSNIILLSNTKDLFLQQPKEEDPVDVQPTNQVAMLFGNPKFYVDTQPGRPAANSGLTRATAEVISELPGTKKEIVELKEYLGDRGWEINDYTELNASEQAIKSISSPKIFHIATHGFFQSETATASALDNELRANAAYDNPLLKTGLLLSGAGDILNETKFNYNIDNGILTAYEAMNLNLDQTDLVVLSACETGLGEIEAGEGVYGLQRAFMVAGAKTIIMSLFKVADDATQQLMVKFYRKWIETGDKRQAFIDAKKEIRNEFGDPLYWGPFIMIGLD
ncbi:MAG: CHAT domain-containing protein [Cytophagales bacterium]|nr:CHAT domain-containing protein [Cytophagales bacterium]